MTTDEEMDAVMKRLSESEDDIVAMMRPRGTDNWYPVYRREMLRVGTASAVRASLKSGNFLVKESFDTKDGVRFLA